MIDFKKNQVISCLGDCITHANAYTEYLQKYVDTYFSYLNLKFVNWGKENETLSGFSEKGCLNSKPFLLDRLDDLLKISQKPDYVIFCYGMHCGVFGAPSESIFCAYEDNLKRFLDLMHEKQIKVILLTPPPLIMDLVKANSDNNTQSKRIYTKTNPYSYYNEEVLEEFICTILYTTHAAIAERIDIYTPLLKNQRMAYDKDPIKPTSKGQKIIAQQVIENVFNNISFNRVS